MKQNFTRLFLLLSVTIFGLQLSAQSYEYNGVQYLCDSNLKVAAVMGCDETVTDLVILDEVNNYPVTSISTYAFKNNKNIKSVTMPNTITNIYDDAFLNCTNLETVKFSSTLHSIHKEAFGGCSAIKSIEFPESLHYILDFAFYGCTSLTAVEIPANIKTIDSYAFGLCTKLTSVTIPESVTVIKDHAFFSCNALQELTIPNSVTEIGFQALFCNSLKKLTIGTGITTVDSNLFPGYTTVKELYVRWTENPTSLGYQFGNISPAYTELFVPRNTTDIYRTVMPWSNFNIIKEYDYSGGVNDIENDKTVQNCSIYNLSGVKVLDNVSSDEVNNSILDAGIYVARYADGTSKKIFIR